jgi:small-conductance mechanosensitive channel
MRWRSLLACGLLTCAASLSALAQPQSRTDDAAAAAIADEDVPTAPVEIDGNVLFRVRGVSSLPAGQRAAGIARRIAEAAADVTIPVDRFQIATAEGQIRIVAGDRVIMLVLPADSRLEHVSQETLALAHVMRVRQGVQAYRQARSPAALRGAALRSLMAMVALLGVILMALWAGAWLDRLAARRLSSRIKTIGIQSFELMRAERIAAGLRNAVAGLRNVAIAISGLVFFAYVLAQWPWTLSLSRNLVGFLLAPLQVIAAGFVRNLPSLIFLLVLFFVLRLIIRLTRLFFEAVGRGSVTFGGFEPEWALPTFKIVRAAIVAFGLVVAYPYIPGSQSDAFKGVTLFLGVVFSVGSSAVIANIIAGYMMTYRRAFRVGDRIKVGNAMGEVLAVRLQVTHMRTLKNEEIVVPNAHVLGNEVVNYSSLAKSRGLILHTEVGIGYETAWRQVEAMLLEAAARTGGVSREPPPFVLVKKLGDFAVTYELNVFSHDVSTMQLQYTVLHRHILDVFNEYGVQIMTPAYESDPQVAKVVPPDGWYAAPAAAPAGPSAAPPTTRGDGASPGAGPSSAPATH